MQLTQLDKSEINKVINLFYIVWKGDKKAIVEKTNWAFSDSTKSKVLVLKDEGNEIISVRGALKWPVYVNDISIKTFQFHGTCVHPNYRRRGLFSLLNKTFVKESVSEKYDLIFNVSVKASRLGYEKLGWNYIKGFRRLTKINKPVVFIKRKLLNIHIEETSFIKRSNKPISIPSDFLIQREKQFKDLIHTKYNKEFLEWRLSNSREGYQSFKDENCIIIYKMNWKDNLIELKIGEVFLLKDRYTIFKKAVAKLIKQIKPDITSTHIFNTHPYYNYYLKMFFAPNPLNYNANFGTRILDEKNKDILTTKKWGMGLLDIDTF